MNSWENASDLQILALSGLVFQKNHPLATGHFFLREELVVAQLTSSLGLDRDWIASQI